MNKLPKPVEQLFVGGFMRTSLISGVIWAILVFCIYSAAQSGSSIFKSLSDQQVKQILLSDRLDSQGAVINELKEEIKTNRAVTQQVGNDLSTLKGVFIGFGGLMTFLQFLTVLSTTRKKPEQ